MRTEVRDKALVRRRVRLAPDALMRDSTFGFLQPIVARLYRFGCLFREIGFLASVLCAEVVAQRRGV